MKFKRNAMWIFLLAFAMFSGCTSEPYQNAENSSEYIEDPSTCSEISSETSSNSSDDISSDEDEQEEQKLSSLHKAIDESSHYVYPMSSEKDGRSDDPDVYDSSIYADDSSENYDDDVIIAYGLLSEADEVRYYMEMGMSLQYNGQTQIIDGRSCWIFALGTEHDDQFVREFYYGVCDNLIYSYDAVNDTWNVLGAG